jgi:hypothetical protein
MSRMRPRAGSYRHAQSVMEQAIVARCSITVHQWDTEFQTWTWYRSINNVHCVASEVNSKKSAIVSPCNVMHYYLRGLRGRRSIIAKWLKVSVVVEQRGSETKFPLFYFGGSWTSYLWQLADERHSAHHHCQPQQCIGIKIIVDIVWEETVRRRCQWILVNFWRKRFTLLPFKDCGRREASWPILTLSSRRKRRRHHCRSSEWRSEDAIVEEIDLKFQLFPLQRSNSAILTFADRRLSAHHCQQQHQHEDEEEEEAPLSEMKEDAIVEESSIYTVSLLYFFVRNEKKWNYSEAKKSALRKRELSFCTKTA